MGAGVRGRKDNASINSWCVASHLVAMAICHIYYGGFVVQTCWGTLYFGWRVVSVGASDWADINGQDFDVPICGLILFLYCCSNWSCLYVCVIVLFVVVFVVVVLYWC